MPRTIRNEQPDDLPDWERELMDHANWDLDSLEYIPGTADAEIGFQVFFGHEQLRLLSALARRERIRPGDLIQRYVAERLEAERDTLAAPTPRSRSA